jgi:hypothetical protein
VCTLIIYPMFCLHYHHQRWSFTASQPCQADWQNS